MPLQVNTNVPYGNACDVSIKKNNTVTEVAFAPDPHGGPEVMWFCFRLEQSGSGAPRGASGERRGRRKVRLVLKNFHNILGADKPQNVRPVLRRPDGDWQRMDPGKPRELPDGRRHATWEIDEPAPFVEVAWCYPYGRPEIARLLEETGGYWREDVIGVSQGRRPLIRLGNGYGEEGSDRPGLYLIARQHSGETPGSWVLDGFLRYIATLGDHAPLVWAVPLANIDGIEQGDYGKDNYPYDLNRAWGHSPMRHETLVIQRDMWRWKDRCRPALGLDFHAPGACEAAGIYAHCPVEEGDAHRWKAAQRWNRVMAEALTRQYAHEPFGRQTSRFSPGNSRWTTPSFSHFCYESIGMPGACIETPYSTIGRLVLTRERYQEAGRRLAAGIVAELG